MVGLNKSSYRQPGKPYMECRKMTKTCPFLWILVMAPRWLSDKESACQHRRCSFDPWVKKIPWSRKWQPTPAFLPGKFQCTEELGCCRGSCSPWSCKVGHDEARMHLAPKHTAQKLRGQEMSPTPLNSSIYSSNQCHCMAIPCQSSCQEQNWQTSSCNPTLPSATDQDIISAHQTQASLAPKTQAAGGSVCHVDRMSGPSPTSALLSAQPDLL